MIKGGYYIKARCIQNSEISCAPPHVREIWDWLIKEANHEDKKVLGTIIYRGQCVRSYRDIQDGLHWMVGWRKQTYSKSDCETAMKWLKKHDMITTAKTTRGMVITVCNYDLYQTPRNYETDKEKTTETTRKPQSDDTINKNEKNFKEEKKNNKLILLSQVDESTLDDKEKEYFQIAISFWELVKANLNELEIESPTTENATYKTWVDPIRLIIEKDKRTINEFREIFKFLQEDEFWRQQIRSTAKLRKKDKDKITYFEILLIKSRNGRKQKSTDQKNNSGVSDDYKQSVFERLQHPERK